LFDKDPTEKFMVNQEEMLERKLNADLIAVPSCNSGLGEVSADGGLYSISGAMLQAGAKSVVSSVHELPDKSTSLITRSFFDNLHAGMKKSEALRKAKLDFLFENGSSKSHPVYWAGLILIGDNLPLSNIIHRPSDGKEYFSFVVAAIASLIVLVVFAIIRKRRRVA
jgi:CHAT domain-containing protein